MRQRNVKNLEEKLELNSSFLIREPRECKGKWKEVFGNDNPIYLEIGCGKGKFIFTHASQNPDRNYIAIEGQENVALRALEKAEQGGLENLRIFMDFVNDLKYYFEEGELTGIYLNFSDPWPKARHAKRRLTSSRFLERYDKIFKDKKQMALLRQVGLEEKANAYDIEAAELKDAINEHLYDEKCGMYFSADLNLVPIDPNRRLHSGKPRHWDCLIMRIDS